MRVCMVTYSLYESDNRVMRYAEALAARGDEVEVISLRKDGCSRELQLNGVRVSRVLTRSFREQRRLSFLKGVGVFWVIALLVVSIRHLRSRYDLLHIHSIPDFMVFVALIPKLMGAKVILDIHDILPELYASKFHASSRSLGFKIMLFLERASAAFADQVIIANHLWRDRLLERAVASDKCTVVLNCPDRSIFRPTRRRSNSDKLVMLYPGTLNEHQGLDVAIRAFAIIKDSVPHAVLLIHGEGRKRRMLEELVASLGLEDRVFFRPFLPLREIATIMGSADLAVVPKRNDRFGGEAFSTKILEFMALGVPVIVPNTKIDKFYFSDSVVQFFSAGDEYDLARCMLRLSFDVDERKRLARNALEFVKDFDWERNKDSYLGLVNSLTGRDSDVGLVTVPEEAKQDAA